MLCCNTEDTMMQATGECRSGKSTRSHVTGRRPCRAVRGARRTGATEASTCALLTTITPTVSHHAPRGLPPHACIGHGRMRCVGRCKGPRARAQKPWSHHMAHMVGVRAELTHVLACKRLHDDVKKHQHNHSCAILGHTTTHARTVPHKMRRQRTQTHTNGTRREETGVWIVATS